MAERELIYKDDARRAVLANAPSIAWCISSIEPVCVVDTEKQKAAPKMDEYWIARIQYWPEQVPVVDVIYIYYAWQNGDIDFIPCTHGEGGPIRSTQCARFEILEKIDLEKYK